MPSDTPKAGAETERLHYCSEHKTPCEKCDSCQTYSYCSACRKCYEPKCADG